MNFRIKELRNALNMSQAEFAQHLGIGQTGVSSIERGNSPVTDRTVSQIVSAFGVNEQWLRTGEGDMYPLPSSEDDELIEIVAELTDSDTDAETKQFIIDFARFVVNAPDYALKPMRDFFDAMKSLIEAKEKHGED